MWHGQIAIGIILCLWNRAEEIGREVVRLQLTQIDVVCPGHTILRLAQEHV